MTVESAASMQDGQDALDVRDLRVRYGHGARATEAVRGVSFTVPRGVSVGLVGQSGSGKSSVAGAVMGLSPDVAQVSGEVHFRGRNLVGLAERQMRGIRGSHLGMVFQDPSAALNPVFPIRTAIVDTIRRHRPEVRRRDARRIAGEMIESLGLRQSDLDRYPHQLSGGMRQRALIAAAMVAEPEFLIADEPTSDLDVLTQRQIIDLLQTLQREKNLGLLLISHDLGVVSALCDHILVMRAGVIVESAPTAQCLRSPSHPYTADLVRISRHDVDSRGRLYTSESAAEAVAR